MPRRAPAGYPYNSKSWTTIPIVISSPSPIFTKVDLASEVRESR